MNEFKLTCPGCGQHMLATPEWIGRQIKCPSCNQSITVTAPLKEPAKNLPEAATPHAESPKPQSSPSPAPLPAPKSEAAEAPAPPPVPPPQKQTEPTPKPKPSAPADAPKAAEQPRVAVLSPAVKLEMVHAVRRRITDESTWLPAEVKGATAYAAKMSDGELVLVDVQDPEATRFSLIGAFLLEMHLLRVVRTAVGRKRFLDEELPDAIRGVFLEDMSDEERERAEDSPASGEQLAISHAQCLAVLDSLEATYMQRSEQRRVESAKRKLGGMRLPELVKKLETKVPIAPEEVATALYHELMEVRRRLESLERRSVREKTSHTDES